LINSASGKTQELHLSAKSQEESSYFSGTSPGGVLSWLHNQPSLLSTTIYAGALACSQEWEDSAPAQLKGIFWADFP